MTREEREQAIAILENEKKCVNRANKNDYCNRDCYNCELVKTDTEILTALDMAIKALNEDTISRGVFEQVMWERDIAIEQLHELGYELGQKIEPCEDTISRSEALSIFRPRGITEDVWKECDVYKKLTALPPVTPQPETGHWEWLTEDKYRCSNCNHETRVDECMNKPMYDFCPFCGAKMVEPKERNE